MFKVKVWDRYSGNKLENTFKTKAQTTGAFNSILKDYAGVGKDIEVVQEYDGEMVRKATWDGSKNKFQVLKYAGND